MLSRLGEKNKNLKDIKPSFSEWLSFAAVAIAGIALIISAWQAFMLRSHNQLTVRPLLDIGINHEIINGYDKIVWLTLKNDGLGPAIIESNDIYLNGRKVDRNDLWAVINKLYSHRHFNLDLLQKGYVLKTGEGQKFFMFDERNLQRGKDYKERIDEYQEFLSIEIQVKYKSLYDEKLDYSCKLGGLFPNLARAYEWQP